MINEQVFQALARISELRASTEETLPDFVALRDGLNPWNDNGFNHLLYRYIQEELIKLLNPLDVPSRYKLLADGMKVPEMEIANVNLVGSALMMSADLIDKTYGPTLAKLLMMTDAESNQGTFTVDNGSESRVFEALRRLKVA